MELVTEFRKRARHVVGPVLGVLAVGYFGYHALHGDRGLFALWRLQHQIAGASQQLATLEAQRQKLQHRVDLLYPQSLDPDLLGERAREMLNFGHPNEYVFLDASADGDAPASNDAPPPPSSSAPVSPPRP